MTESKQVLSFQLESFFEILICIAAICILASQHGVNRGEQLFLLGVVGVSCGSLLLGWGILIVLLRMRGPITLSPRLGLALGTGGGGAVIGSFVGASYALGTILENDDRFVLAVIFATREGLQWMVYWGVIAYVFALVIDIIYRRYGVELGPRSLIGLFVGALFMALVFGVPFSAKGIISWVGIPALIGYISARIGQKCFLNRVVH